MLNNLINDLLDLAKFENGKFIFNESYFSLPILVTKAMSVIKYFADEKDIKLILVIVLAKKMYTIYIGENEDLLRDSRDFANILFNNLYGDQRRYLQILLNFVSNALKFTNQGGTITIKLVLEELQKKSSKFSYDNRRHISNFEKKV